MSRTAKSLMACALLLYAAAFVSCHVLARPRDPAPGEAWASGHSATGWFDLGIMLLIAAGGVTFAAIRFAYDKTD